MNTDAEVGRISSMTPVVCGTTPRMCDEHRADPNLYKFPKAKYHRRQLVMRYFCPASSTLDTQNSWDSDLWHPSDRGWISFWRLWALLSFVLISDLCNLAARDELHGQTPEECCVWFALSRYIMELILLHHSSDWLQRLNERSEMMYRARCRCRDATEPLNMAHWVLWGCATHEH